MFGAEKFASTSRIFLSKFLASDVAVSMASVVFPTPPLIDTKLRMFVILSPRGNNVVCIFKPLEVLRRGGRDVFMGVGYSCFQ